MPIDLYQGGIHIGSVVRSSGGSCYCYLPDGSPLGQVASLDAAAMALAERMKAEASRAA